MKAQNLTLPYSATLQTKPLGQSKAKKFAEVEGMALSEASATQLNQFQTGGLHGDALRAALTATFRAKSGE